MTSSFFYFQQASIKYEAQSRNFCDYYVIIYVSMTSSTPFLNTDEICTGPESDIFTRSFEIQRIFVAY